MAFSDLTCSHIAMLPIYISNKAPQLAEHNGLDPICIYCKLTKLLRFLLGSSQPEQSPSMPCDVSMLVYEGFMVPGTLINTPPLLLPDTLSHLNTT